MNKEKKHRLLAVVILNLGLIQVVSGYLTENLIFASYGGVYAVIGADWLWFEM